MDSGGLRFTEQLVLFVEKNAPLLGGGLVRNWTHILLKEADEFVLVVSVQRPKVEGRNSTTSHLVMKQLVDR